MAAADEVRLAESFQAQQRALSSSLLRQIVELIEALLNLGDVDRSWEAVRRAIGALVRDQRRASADFGALYYRQARTAAGLPAAPALGRPRPLSPERLEKSLDSAGLGVYYRSIRLNLPPEVARDRMVVAVSGAATRLALEGGRDVVENSVREDEDALGWARVGDGDSCAWCLMLISRGSVYRSAQSAGSVAAGGELYHDHDGCQVVPIFDPESPLLARADELYTLWREVTAGNSGEEARKAWRRYWEGRGEPAEPALT
jgi:hypothetical protein